MKNFKISCSQSFKNVGAKKILGLGVGPETGASYFRKAKMEFDLVIFKVPEWSWSVSHKL